MAVNKVIDTAAIGQRIRGRKKLNLTREELAEILGLSVTM